VPLFQNPNSTNSANYDTLTQATIGCPCEQITGTFLFWCRIFSGIQIRPNPNKP